MNQIQPRDEHKFLFDGNKLLWHMDRVHEHYRDGQRIAPLHIDIGATKLCNAQCIYCYGIYQEMSRDIIETPTLVKLFNDAPALGIRSLTLTGDGEPTLNPGIYEALSVGKHQGLDIGLATNGIALDTPKLTTMLNTCTWIRFNLSGVSRESYKSIHGVDHWDRVQANIKQAVSLKKRLKSKCTIGLQMVLVPQCVNQVIPEAQFAVTHGLDYFVIKQFSDPGCEEMSRFSLDWYDNPEVLATLEYAEKLSTPQTRIVPKWNMISAKGKRPYDRCVDCPLIFQISGNSKCYPCGYLFNNEEFCYGDLKEQSLGEILRSDRYWSIIKRMKEDFDVHTECSGSCRHDFTNAFMWNYLHPPTHLNFI